MSLSPELQALVDAKEAATEPPKYFLGGKEVKVMRIETPRGYRWLQITDERLDAYQVKGIHRVPPLQFEDNFA